MSETIDNFLKLGEIQAGIHNNVEFAKAFFEKEEDQLVTLQERYRDLDNFYSQYYSTLGDIFQKLSQDAGVPFLPIKDQRPMKEFFRKMNVHIEDNCDLYNIYFTKFPKLFNYFLFKTTVEIKKDRTTKMLTHKQFMKNLYEDEDLKALYYNLVKVELMTPQFIRFLNKNLDITHRFFETTFTCDDKKAFSDFIDNFTKNAHKCPEYILDLILIDEKVFTDSLKSLILKHPHILNLVPYYKTSEVDQNDFDIKELTKGIKRLVNNNGEFTNLKSVFIPEEIDEAIKKFAGTSSRQTETRPVHESLRNLLKILPPLPIIQKESKISTIKEYLEFSISLIHTNKRKFFEKELQTIIEKEDQISECLEKSRNDLEAFNFIIQINPISKMMNMNEYIKYTNYYQFIGRYENRYKEIMNQIFGYAIIIFEQNKEKSKLEYLKYTHHEVFEEKQRHLDFNPDDYMKFKSDYHSYDAIMMKYSVNGRFDAMNEFENGQVTAMEFQIKLFKDEKWIKKKDKFVRDMSFNKDPIELYKIFTKYQDKIMKKFTLYNRDIGQDQLTPFYFTYFTHLMPPDVESTMRYIAKYIKIYPTTQMFYEDSLTSILK